jgi:hypothetical protein
VISEGRVDETELITVERIEEPVEGVLSVKNVEAFEKRMKRRLTRIPR